MENKIVDFLMGKADLKSILLLIPFLIILIFTLILFVKLVKTCVYFEQASGIYAFTLPKVILIAAAPTIYNVFSMLDVNVDKHFKLCAVTTAIVCTIILVLNIKSFGIVYGTMFSIMHITFGLLASVAISALALVAIIGIVLMLFGGASVSSSSYSTSSPEYVRDPDTGELVYVEKGVNGELYIEGTSKVLRKSDYPGRYIDSDNNEYII